MTDLLDAVLAACDRHGSAAAVTRGLRSARLRRTRLETHTYAELGAAIRSTAAGLRAEGMQRGDRVLFSVRPGPDAVILALAIVLAGGTVVFADPGAGEALFRARTALAAPKWVAAESLLYFGSSGPLRPLARRRGLDLAPYARLVPDARHLYVGPWLPGVPRGALPVRGLRSAARRATRLETPPVGYPGDGFETRPAAPGAPQPTGGRESDEALIVFTSGTTDAPRAVVHTRGSLGAGLADVAASSMRAGQRVVTDQLMVGIPALIAGAHWIMPTPGLDPGASPKRYLGLLPDAEVLFTPPAALDAILRLLDDAPHLAPLRLETLILGGAPVLRPLLERAFARFPGVTIRAVYGMTEILPVAIADGAEKLARRDAEGDYAGRLVPSVRARLDTGELVLSGPGLAAGYLGEPPLAEVRTGDLARLDGDQLVLLGRKKDMFIRGTQNVYPGLYEPVIAGLPGVREAVMTGVPDAIGDDRIVVLVVPDDPPAHPDSSHPVARAVARALPGLIDAGALPDLVVAVPELPRAGRSRKLDRAAVAGIARSLS
ncbi:class I adenylate-forming enzyme family protein [Pseudolysinimonas yzui]|uniref:Fatty-acyl-CoA synthase n=1 Tax=Pseudolysinimonas yzui TaxID=2708254 RepID=A0A8J3GR21_9MICO|nr:class I adenylate-forming enzyme family protein [Pseudolysinimonas yzui]GHF19200.1 fatty-acyl-CoA synthase [Pseudolysinimonas yzui]